MTEVAQIPTGIMPHGSRMNAAGSRQYSVAMMDDELREIDAYQLRNRRILPLSENAPSWEHYRQTGNGLVEEGEGADGASATEGMRHDMAMNYLESAGYLRPSAETRDEINRLQAKVSKKWRR